MFQHHPMLITKNILSLITLWVSNKTIVWFYPQSIFFMPDVILSIFFGFYTASPIGPWVFA